MSDTSSIFCSIRKEWVAALPEELVRQRLLTHMVQERGFPAPLIVVEKSLRQLPHLTIDDGRRIPSRRADILCFAKGIGESSGLSPLLLVECKAIALSRRVVDQVVGYNHFVRASFVTVVNQTEMRTGWYDREREEYVFLKHLPTYEELVSALK